MTEVITITLIAGFIIFALGIVSARERRKQREAKARGESFTRVKAHELAQPRAQTLSDGSAMSMAAAIGNGNGRPELETVGNTSR